MSTACALIPGISWLPCSGTSAFQKAGMGERLEFFRGERVIDIINSTELRAVCVVVREIGLFPAEAGVNDPDALIKWELSRNDEAEELLGAANFPPLVLLAPSKILQKIKEKRRSSKKRKKNLKVKEGRNDKRDESQTNIL